MPESKIESETESCTDRDWLEKDRNDDSGMLGSGASADFVSDQKTKIVSEKKLMRKDSALKEKTKDQK